MGLPEGRQRSKIGLVVYTQFRLWQAASHPATHPRCRIASTALTTSRG